MSEFVLGFIVGSGLWGAVLCVAVLALNCVTRDRGSAS